jgi:hypothetical protein
VLGPPTSGTDRVQGRPGLPQQDLTGLGEGDLAGGAPQQRHPELALQLPDRAGQRRLRHAQPRGGAPEVSFLGDRDEVAKLSRLQLIHTPTVSTGIGSILQVHRRTGFTDPEHPPKQRGDVLCVVLRCARSVTYPR